MKRIMTILFFIGVIAISSQVSAQDKTFKDGSVWDVSYIKTGANMTDTYLNSIKDTWKKVNEEAMKQGLIVSYKILSSAAANPDDFDIMLMVEYKSLAAMEASQDKIDGLFKTVIGGEEVTKKINESRISMRSIFGNKMFREVVYK